MFERKSKFSTCTARWFRSICHSSACLLSDSFLCSVSLERLALANFIPQASPVSHSQVYSATEEALALKESRSQGIFPLSLLGRRAYISSSHYFSSVVSASTRQPLYYGPNTTFLAYRSSHYRSGPCFWAPVRTYPFPIPPFPKGVVAACS